jgi:secondary thiamine-phosphate synthase enzyme
MVWLQKHVTLAARPRGCHLVTSDVVAALGADLRGVSIGIAHVHILHTSASLTLNENADPSVRTDMETVLNRLVPQSEVYVHDDEGPDDMPAHAKASLMGASVTIPVTDGRFALGTWQGIYLCEHRDYGGPRRLVVTVHGEAAAGGGGGKGSGASSSSAGR